MQISYHTVLTELSWELQDPARPQKETDSGISVVVLLIRAHGRKLFFLEETASWFLDLCSLLGHFKLGCMSSTKDRMKRSQRECH